MQNAKTGEELINLPPEFTILNISVENSDSTYNEKIIVNFEADALVNKGEVEISPIFLNAIKENPFTEKNRIYPVTLPFLTVFTWNFSLKFDSDHKASEIPKSETIEFADKSFRLVYTAKQLTNMVQITAQFSMFRRQFRADSYSNIKDYYDDIVKKMTETIQIKKKFNLLH